MKSNVLDEILSWLFRPENSFLWLTFSFLENAALFPLHGRMQSIFMEKLCYKIIAFDSKFYQMY